MIQANQENNEDNDSGDQELTPGLVGLQNLGNTCYMNGALQALSNCQQLTRFILDCPGSFKEKRLCHSYSELIKQMWNNGNSQYAVPTNVIRNIKCIYPAFRGCTQQDTQEFLRCFLEQLHDELKQPTKIQDSENCHQLTTDSGDKDSCSETTNNTNNCNNILNKSPQVCHKSIISDTFEFKISSSVVCSSCNNISTTKESFKDLSIPIPSGDHPYYRLSLSDSSNSQYDTTDGYDYDSASASEKANLIEDHDHLDQVETFRPKIEQPDLSENNHTSDDSCQDHDDNPEQDTSEIDGLAISQGTSFVAWFWSWLDYFKTWLWGPTVRLVDCLSIFFGTDSLEGDNEYSCEVCTKKNRGVKYLKILELPEVLCIHFKRYESVGSTKITTHVSFPLEGLDLAPFMSENARPQCTTYNLIACICHHGSALLTGHYTTYALNCYDDQWYEFDDQYVTHVPRSQVENCEAYILFYQKATPDNRTHKEREIASKLLKKSFCQNNATKYFISKQWVNKFNTFVEPGPITNHDFLCIHEKVPKSRQAFVGEMCHPISETVWKYLQKLHGGGPGCQELQICDICE